MICVAVDHGDNIRCCQEAASLIIHTIFRPISENEPVLRDDPLSLRKREGEGTPCKCKIVLGWMICTRTFRILLPVYKARNWLLDIDEILDKDSRVTTKTSKPPLVVRTTSDTSFQLDVTFSTG